MSGGLMKAWSYSRYEAYDQCPLKARYKFVDKLPEESNAALERGDSVHKTVAQYLRGDLPVNDPIPGWTHFANLFRELRALEPSVEQEWGFDASWRPVGWFDKMCWFRSKLDAALVYEDHTADVIDFKTGKPYGDKTRKQAELYALSVFCRDAKVQNVTVRFWYLDLEQNGKEEVFTFLRHDAPSLLKKWTARAEMMMRDTIMPPNPGQHCNWCPFAKSKGGPCKYG